jgi:hypothetical protein
MMCVMRVKSGIMRFRAEKDELLVDCIGKTTLLLWVDRPFSQCLFSRYSPKCSHYEHNTQFNGLTVTVGVITSVPGLELAKLMAINFARA